MWGKSKKNRVSWEERKQKKVKAKVNAARRRNRKGKPDRWNSDDVDDEE